MDVIETDLPGLRLIKPKRYGDNRGFFSEVYSARALAEAGIHDVFIQDNHSYSADRGVLRGLHYQSPPHAQVKLLRVTRGVIFDVAVDIRRGSPTYGRHFGTELSADNWCQLYVPAGFAHGFATLTSECEVLYKVDSFFAPSHDFGLCWNDPDLGIDWPVAAADVILSTRDSRHPCLKDLDSPFQYGRAR